MHEPFYYGVCYYPEAWDAKRHASDIARIADCGFNFVRMGEGAWSYWEPEEGRFQFDLFDRVIDHCRKHKIQVILGTPTYAAPAWVSHNYPEVLRWNFERIPMAHGSRRNLNYTAPKYLELSDRICTALAEHYRDETQVIAWQLDNEFNCHMDVSYSPSDAAAFRGWLKEKYRTLAKLNAAWGTGFWSQTYSAWEQIDLPHPTATYHNPSQLLDESRFISDCVVAFARRQAAILRAANPKWRITHNGLFGNVNGRDLTTCLDFFSHDQYPQFYKRWTDYSYNLVQSRSFSFPFGILEQQAGAGGQMAYLHPTPRPGEMRRWALQSIAHGANLFSYFRWRTCPYGSEQHWHGLLDVDDRNNRRIGEAKQVAADLKKLPRAFFAAEPERSVGVLADYDNDINDRRINTYTKHGAWERGRWLAELGRRHVPHDIVWPDSDWRGVKMLIAPHLKIVDRALVAKLDAFVRAGGALILTAQGGTKDRNCHMREQTAPGPLRALAGIEVRDWTALPDDLTCTARTTGGATITMNTFVERLDCKRAKPLAMWDGDDPLLAGGCAAAVNDVGRGRVYYIGGYLPDAGVSAVLAHLAQREPAALRPIADASPEIELLARRGKGKRYVIAINHGTASETVKNIRGRDLLGKRLQADAISLDANAVAIVESPPREEAK